MFCFYFFQTYTPVFTSNSEVFDNVISEKRKETLITFAHDKKNNNNKPIPSKGKILKFSNKRL